MAAPRSTCRPICRGARHLHLDLRPREGSPRPQTRRTYTSKGRQDLAWLADAGADVDPIRSADGRDWAVRDDRNHLQGVLKRKPARRAARRAAGR
jgi:hypothetical protein